jgi:multidrug efflux pump
LTTIDPPPAEPGPDVSGANMSAVFIRRPVATTLLTLAIALLGVAAYFVLPVAPLPQVDLPTISIQANDAGASPNVVAATVATPLERQLGTIADVTEMTSQSGTGSTRITLQFGLDRDINGAARDVEAAIDAAKNLLPTSSLLSLPTYRKVNPALRPIIIIGLTSDTLAPYQIYDKADILLNQAISQVQGVGEVDIGGATSPAVRVEMNPLAMNKYGIGTEDVRAAIDSTNFFLAKGTLSVGDRSYQINTNDQANSAPDYQNVIVAFRNNDPVRLKDIAEVVDGPANLQNLGLVNGKPGVVLRVTQSPGANIITTVDIIKKLLPELQTALGPQIKVTTIVDNSTSIRASINDVETTLLLSVILVVLVVLVFLRNGRATLIPGVAVTVSLIGTLALMYVMHFSLDNLSLMSLTIATGFVVDDAIVVLENITRHVEAGMPRMKAALLGSREVGFTVMSMSISLIAVFIPILAMGGLVGRLFREFGLTLSASILISLVVSLTATPMMAARLIDEHPGEGKDKKKGLFSRLSQGFEWGFDKTLHTYERCLIWALDNSLLVLISLILTVFLTVYLYMIVPKGFFPQEDNGLLIGQIQSDQSSSFDNTSAKMKRVQGIITHDPAVQSSASFSSQPNGFTFITLKPKNERKVTADQVIARLQPKLAHIAGINLFLQSAQTLQVGGRSSGAQYQYTLQSDDADTLLTWSNKMYNAMKALPDLAQVNTDQQSHALETYLTFDRQTAARFGLTTSQIDKTLGDSFAQSNASTIYNPLNQYHVVIEVAQPYQREPDALKNIYVTSPSANVTSAGVVTSVSAATGSTTTGGGGGGGGGGASTALTLPTSASITSNALTAPLTTSATGVGSFGTSTSSSTSGTLGGTTGTITNSSTSGASTTAVANPSSTSSATPSITATGIFGTPATPTSKVGLAGIFGTAASTANPTSYVASPSLLSGSNTSSALTAGQQLSGAGSSSSTTGGGTATATGVAISTSAEQMTPLSAFSSYALGNTPLAVNHQNTSVAATISFNMAPGKALSDAQREIEQVKEQIGLPSTVVGSFQGTAQQYTASLASEPLLILAALVAVYIVLGILYESYIHPLTVISSLPSAGVGAVLAMLIFNVQFTVISLIGVILLIGIVKKNAIMLIDFALVAEREQNLSSRDAIYQACILRFRPILMTTCAAILGAVPLALGLGQGGELRQPLGISIIGGLVVSQMLTLLTTPVVYLYLDRLRTRGRRRYPRGLGGGSSPANGPRRGPSPGPSPMPAE